MFGYGLYMYDLQSLKLTEAESKVKRLERLEHSQGSELKQLKNSKNELEEKLQKVKNQIPTDHLRFLNIVSIYIVFFRKSMNINRKR